MTQQSLSLCDCYYPTLIDPNVFPYAQFYLPPSLYRLPSRHRSLDRLLSSLFHRLDFYFLALALISLSMPFLRTELIGLNVFTSFCCFGGARLPRKSSSGELKSSEPDSDMEGKVIQQVNQSIKSKETQFYQREEERHKTKKEQKKRVFISPLWIIDKCRQMHLNILTDSQLQGALTNLQKIVQSYQHHFFYNRTLVDPYLLASHGITISRKRISTLENPFSYQAVCTDPHCDLAFQLDNHQDAELKEDLQSVIRDHDPSCSYFKIRSSLICFKLFVRLGRRIYEETLGALRSQKTWVQLNPQEILDVVERKIEKQGQGDTYGSTWSQLKLLDPSMAQQTLKKVKSQILLAIFGWSWQGKALLSCSFCGAIRDVTEFISPLEFSLLKMTEGFSFVSSHHSWCCLVAPNQDYWQEILRQAVVGELKELEGGASKTWLQLECKNIQRNLLQIFTEHIVRINALRRETDSKRSQVQSKMMKNVGMKAEQEEGELQQKEDPFKTLTEQYVKLGQLLEQQKRSEEELIMSIRTV